ncbi:MAG: hypothetical protein ACJ8GK_13855 [Luteimonas sp.]
MPTDPTSLTSEERELAERLARVDPHAEPSPTVDARILAAAREAAATTARRRRRWPTALGLAASLLLAVGVAWRLRPLPERPSPPPSPPPRAEARAPTQARAAATGASATFPAAANTREPPTDTLSGEAPRPDTTREAPVAQAQGADDAMADRTAPLARDAAPAMKTAEASRTPAEDSSSQAFGDVAAPPPPAPPVPPTMPSEPAPAPALGDEAARAASASGDEPELDVPPATADAPEVRDAWLQRIQALVEAGDIDSARASLRAFVARYPAYTLPENLRALAR